jgi:hypothetical protein
MIWGILFLRHGFCRNYGHSHGSVSRAASQNDATLDVPLPNEKGCIRYDYFLISDENMLETRTFDQDQDTYLRPIAQRDYPDDLGNDSIWAVRVSDLFSSRFGR